jgi:hypothetical protein
MTIVKILLRGDSSTPDEVDLDRLSPRARALAEAAYATLGKAAVDIWLRSAQPIMEMDPNWRFWWKPEEAAEPEMRPWRGWATYLRSDPLDAYEYLEREAAKIPASWHPYGAHPREPVASMEAAAKVREATTAQVIDYLREHGRPIGRATWSHYVSHGQAPAPVRKIARTPIWDLADVDAWLGRGQS